VKGGGHPFAALVVGSRGVGKRKTLAKMTCAVRVPGMGAAVERIARLVLASR
jgi:hypothetical protein